MNISLLSSIGDLFRLAIVHNLILNVKALFKHFRCYFSTFKYLFFIG